MFLILNYSFIHNQIKLATNKDNPFNILLFCIILLLLFEYTRATHLTQSLIRSFFSSSVKKKEQKEEKRLTFVVLV